jgi:hypothetical protein
MISCELQDIEEIMSSAGILLTGEAYDTAQDYLQVNCPCATYRHLQERERASNEALSLHS